MKLQFKAKTIKASIAEDFKTIKSQFEGKIVVLTIDSGSKSVNISNCLVDGRPGYITFTTKNKVVMSTPLVAIKDINLFESEEETKVELKLFDSGIKLVFSKRK